MDADEVERRARLVFLIQGFIPRENWDEINDLLEKTRLFRDSRNFCGTLRELLLKIVQSGDLDELKFFHSLIRKKVSDVRYILRIFETKYPGNGFTIVSWAALQWKADVDIVQFLVEKCCPSKYDILEVTDNYGKTPLERAILEENSAVAEYLLTVLPRRIASLRNLNFAHSCATYSSHCRLCRAACFIANVEEPLMSREIREAFEAECYLEGIGIELPVLILNLIGQHGELLYRRRYHE